MGILVVGSVAFDSVKTPFGEAPEILGGSATYFSMAASFFTEVSLVGVVGDDFGNEHVRLLSTKGIDLRGLERVPGKTFRWAGEYSYDLNNRTTLDTQLNVFADFKPRIIPEYQTLEYVFLGNIDPTLQRDVLRQIRKPVLVGCDTMNFWIERQYDSLIETLKFVDILVINDGETRELARESNLIKAARKIQALGPRTVVIKRGEYGVLMFNDGLWFSAPAFPLEDVFDPTGAGDSFAGGFMGYLAAARGLDAAYLKKAIIFGSVMASFNVEEFGVNRLTRLTYPEVIERYRQFKALTHFEDLGNDLCRS
ncbi:MAG: sugar kinase [Acidobacteria bacterium]|nr:sugar kinase [Acidobacteriota bacterium]MBI3656183.1 sugar kinase [Acidobacteriota bacterium]